MKKLLKSTRGGGYFTPCVITIVIAMIPTLDFIIPPFLKKIPRCRSTESPEPVVPNPGLAAPYSNVGRRNVC
jgi:hypothetical protein